MSRLFVCLQHWLPARTLGRLVHRLSRARLRWWKNLLILGFCRLYGVDRASAARPVPDGYASFNAFFTRELKPGLRPIDPDPAALVAPADGRIAQFGEARAGRLLQAKGLDYSLADLCGSDRRAERYRDGAFLTIYLAPRDYHRVHAPAAGRLRWMHHIPGERFAVNAATAARLPGLFARNERLVCHFEGDWGPFAVVLVGALNVASIGTAWTGELPAPDRARLWHYPPPSGPCLDRGQYLGQFNLGSTVILLLPPGAARLDPGLTLDQRVFVGRRIGSLAGGT
ncbi:MAG: phosphatidylserine decarboxylase [Gammaproteobacteria bacterium]|nr:MAG: phosphatidylserine decarboxylase [Gammaproteobacteria bacterium]